MFLRRDGVDADWICVTGQPPKLAFGAGMVGGHVALPDMPAYDVIVVQQPRGKSWFHQIKRWQDRGQRVVFEVDDYLHGIRKMPDHDFRHYFSKRELADLELNMRACDGMICSTEFLARKYRRYNRNTYVCENGLDLARYQLTRPSRQTVNVGWAGGTGHLKAAIPWLQQLGVVMGSRPDVNAVTIGAPYADQFKKLFGQHRAISTPWSLIDTYPAAMTLLDVALAPAGRGDFFKGKSDLRWLEAGALGIPIIADPTVYWRIEHGVNGFHAETPDEAREHMLELVASEKLRTEVGDNARQYVYEERDMHAMFGQWRTVLEDLTAEAAA
jgi:glycosyltransferase involved in cell wall biosynthesis